MISQRPGVLAVRAVNQYRRRDVLAYMALRYYLDNSAARSDEWARRVATHLVLTRTGQPYFSAQHFKEVTANGNIKHRAMFIPCANEAIAEAALLEECAKHPEAFANPDCVYSYSLNSGESRSGYYNHYIHGLRARHEAIARACEQCPTGVVRYTDIKQFYPSVDVSHARAAWQTQCAIAKLSDRHRFMGERLIDDYGQASGKGRHALLTGPMFAHLLANLVLRGLDAEFSTQLPVRYFRYVDDITLVGEPGQVARSLETIRSKIGSLGLILHDDDSPKNLQISCNTWMSARDDFREDRGGASWAKLIGNLKRFLLLHPADQHALQEAFRNEGFRVPVRDYSTAVLEMDQIARILQWARWKWFRRRTHSISIAGLVQQARLLRAKYEAAFHVLLDSLPALSDFDRKRRIPKLRYCIARLIYLANDDTLLSFADMVRGIGELFFHAEIMATVADGNLDRVLEMGTNAAQATAQPLKASGKQATTTFADFPATKQQSLAVFLMNGVAVRQPNPALKAHSELVRFAVAGADLALMKSTDPFIRELACLHGLSGVARHPEMLDRVFDEDETMTMDAVELLQQSVAS